MAVAVEDKGNKEGLAAAACGASPMHRGASLTDFATSPSAARSASTTGASIAAWRTTACASVCRPAVVLSVLIGALLAVVPLSFLLKKNRP